MDSVEITTREIAQGVHAIQACEPRPKLTEQLTAENPDWFVPESEVHSPRTAYLLQGEQTLIYDPLSPADTEHVNPVFDELLDGGALDYVVVSHPDAPHAGNTGSLLTEHPEATLVAPGQGGRHDLYRLEESLKVLPGDRLDLGGLSVRFHEATFLDSGLSIWMVEEEHDILFTADWFGFPHLAGDCLQFVDELDRELAVHQLVQLHARVFFWYQYVDAERVEREIDHLEEMGPSIIAPAHGLVARQDIPERLEQMKQVVGHVNERGRLKAFGAR